MSKITIQEAEFLTGMTRQAINYATKNGSLSYTLNEKNVKVVDISELQRAGYTFTKTIEELEAFKNNNKTSKGGKPRKKDDVKEASKPEFDIQLLTQELNSTKTLLENSEKERKRERDSLEQQNETLTSSLKKAQETAHNVTLLLENNVTNKDNGNDWQKSMKAVESRISNQEKKSKEEKELTNKILRQNQALKKALDAEKNKSIWQKLFG